MAETSHPIERTPHQNEIVAYGRCVQVYRAEGNTPAEIAELLKDHPGRPTAAQAAAAEIANASAKPVPARQITPPAPPVPLTPAAKRKAEAARAAAEAGKAESAPQQAEAPPPLTSLPAAMAGEWDVPPAAAVPVVTAEE